MVQPSQPALSLQLQRGDVKSWTPHEILLCRREVMAGDGSTEDDRLAGKVLALHWYIALIAKLPECRN